MPYAELLEFNQPNPIRRPGFTRIRDAFELESIKTIEFGEAGKPGNRVITFADPERIMEFAGRWDYGAKNAEKLGSLSKSGEPILQKWINSGEQSMVEMGWATFFFECSRVVTHELVRHRIGSYQQESQRFTKYDAENMDEFFVVPEGMEFTDVEMLRQAYGNAFKVYKELRDRKVAPQLARYALPNAARTRIIMSCNVRQWRHVLRLRADKSAQPEMQEMMQQAYLQLSDVFPQTMAGVLDLGRGVR